MVCDRSSVEYTEAIHLNHACHTEYVFRRGSKTVSVLANLYSDKFSGFSFMNPSYIPPLPMLTYDRIRQEVRRVHKPSFGTW